MRLEVPGAWKQQDKAHCKEQIAGEWFRFRIIPLFKQPLREEPLVSHELWALSATVCPAPKVLSTFERGVKLGAASVGLQGRGSEIKWESRGRNCSCSRRLHEQDLQQAPWESAINVNLTTSGLCVALQGIHIYCSGSLRGTQISTVLLTDVQAQQNGPSTYVETASPGLLTNCTRVSPGSNIITLPP